MKYRQLWVSVPAFGIVSLKTLLQRNTSALSLSVTAQTVHVEESQCLLLIYLKSYTARLWLLLLVIKDLDTLCACASFKL
jgi:hypothetical protein